jgi:uncharacterized protein (TIGR03435 family)
MAQTEARPQFEVASIKPAAPDAQGNFFRFMPGGGVNISNMNLKEMIMFAWRMQPFQVSGGPSWLGSERFDVTAKSDHPPKDGERQLMLQQLLEERFKLTIRQETKELPIYALVLARKDGKLGPRLVESKEGDCRVPDPASPGPPPQGSVNCGQQIMNPQRLSASSVPVGNITPMLSRILGRTVIDRTGLTAKYNITMEWTPDESLAMQPPPDAPKLPAADGAGPTIFTALMEQLGLKLEAQKGPVEVIVVERAEKPTEN